MPADDIMFSGHAMTCCFERGLAPNAVIEAIRNGRTISEYLDDRPYPSRLVLGYVDERPVHVVVAESEYRTIVVTAYQPDPALWNKAL